MHCPGTAFLARPKVRRFVAAAFGLFLLILALIVLHRAFGNIDPRQVLTLAADYPRDTLLCALFLALASYLVLCGFDWLGLRHIRRPLPLGVVMMVSFVSHAISHNAGFAVVTGGAVRLRMYAVFGLNAAEIAGIVTYAGLTFALGVMGLAGLAFILEAGRVAPLLHLSPGLVTMIGWGLLSVLGLYFAWAAWARHPLRLGPWHVATPSLPMASAQIVVAAIDLALVAGTLYVLLPMHMTGIGYPAFLGLYVVATVAGTISHVPGGLGVFEGALLLLLPAAPPDQVLAALLVFRLLYNLIPLILGAAILGLFEIVNKVRPVTVKSLSQGGSKLFQQE